MFKSNLTALLYLSPTVGEIFLAEFWRQHTSGDHEFFARKLLNSALGDEAVLLVFWFGQKHAISGGCCD